MRLVCLVPAIAVLPAACGHWDEVDESGLRHLSRTATSDNDGLVTLRLPIAEGDAAALVTTAPQTGWTFLFQVQAADKEVLFDTASVSETRTNVTGAQNRASRRQVNWPALGAHPALVEGKLRVLMASTNTASGDAAKVVEDVPFEVDVLIKEDDDLTGGTLLVDLVLAGSAATDPDLLSGIEAAADRFVEVYQGAGIDVLIETSEYADGSLFAPGFGSSAEYLAISTARPIRAVTVVILPGELRDNDPDDTVDFGQVLGVSGGIPGSLVPTGQGAVTLSAALHAGPDLRFSPVERRMFGETIAHEVGHYLGLFHPVESVDTSFHDALDDTPLCDAIEDCEPTLGDNVMFPYPVTRSGSFIAQDVISPQQIEVMNLYVGVQ